MNRKSQKREKRMQQNIDFGTPNFKSKYAQKKENKAKGIFSDNSPLKETDDPIEEPITMSAGVVLPREYDLPNMRLLDDVKVNESTDEMNNRKL